MVKDALLAQGQQKPYTPIPSPPPTVNLTFLCNAKRRLFWLLRRMMLELPALASHCKQK